MVGPWRGPTKYVKAGKEVCYLNLTGDPNINLQEQIATNFYNRKFPLPHESKDLSFKPLKILPIFPAPRF